MFLRGLLPVFVSLTFLLTGCGGTQKATAVVLTTEDLLLFGNGADYAADPEQLSGSWRQTWEADQRKRVLTADVIAVIEIKSFSTDETSEVESYYRLVSDVKSKLFGNICEDIVLRARPRDPGFSSIDGRERMLLNKRFVVSLRWHMAKPGADAEPRWHLSPASDAIVDHMQSSIAEHRGGQGNKHRKVIIHNNN